MKPFTLGWREGKRFNFRIEWDEKGLKFLYVCFFLWWPRILYMRPQTEQERLDQEARNRFDAARRKDEMAKFRASLGFPISKHWDA